jgi:hypothetical protein
MLLVRTREGRGKEVGQGEGGRMQERRATFEKDEKGGGGRREG